LRTSCLVITSNATLDIGGEGIFAKELAIELKKSSEVYSAFLIRNEKRGAEFVQGLEDYAPRSPRIKNSIVLVSSLFLFVVTAIPLALKYIKGQRKNGQSLVIHAHDGTFSGIVAVAVGKLSSAPVIITFHGTHILSAYYIFNRLSRIASVIATRLTSFCVENSDYIIGVDPNTVKCIKYATKTDKAMEIIPTFCRRLDDEKCAMRETVIPTLPANSRLIAYVGRLSPEKNVLSLVKVFGEISGTMSNVYLIIAGDGVLREKIEHLVKEMRIQNRVFLFGYVFNISPILKRLECIVLPSKSEGFPQVILEAWTLGVPVVASNRIPFLENEVNGLTFPP
jgi:glycosyltransferase involved in cell wall biosynthesis